MFRHHFARFSQVSSSKPAGTVPAYPFDGVFVLNLDRRTDRWRHVQTQLRRARIPMTLVTRASGIDGAATCSSPQQVDGLVRDGVITAAAARRLLEVPNKDKLFGMDLTPGAVGCAIGHRRIWERIVAADLRCALILEDDVEFHPSIARTFAERWASVPSDWELMYLGGVDLLKDGKPPRPFVAEGVRYAYKGHRELTAYVLHAKSARRCLELTKPMSWQIDTHICMNCTADAAAQDEFISDPRSYVFQPALAIQIAKFGTDVQKQADATSALTDAARRMREFVGGETSVR